MYDFDNDKTITLNKRQLVKLRNCLNRIDTSEYTSYNLWTTDCGEVYLQLWGDDVITERVSAAEPKLEVLSCIR